MEAFSVFKRPQITCNSPDYLPLAQVAAAALY